MHNENMEEIKSISMQNVTFSYKGKKRYVFEDFSVDIEPNHITGIIGRNGQGKTTLMNLIAGKFEPDEGIIEIDGKNPATDIGTAKRIVYVAGVMSYSEMKLKKIIEEYRLMYEKFDEEFAHKLMELFGLNKKAKITICIELICLLIPKINMIVILALCENIILYLMTAKEKVNS